VISLISRAILVLVCVRRVLCVYLRRERWRIPEKVEGKRNVNGKETGN